LSSQVGNYTDEDLHPGTLTELRSVYNVQGYKIRVALHKTYLDLVRIFHRKNGMVEIRLREPKQ
jgi:hypothetical protein